MSLLVVAGCRDDEAAAPSPEGSARPAATVVASTSAPTVAATSTPKPPMPPWHFAPGSAPSARASAAVTVTPPSIDDLSGSHARCPERVRKRLFVLQGGRVIVDEPVDGWMEAWKGRRLDEDTRKRMRPLVSVAEGAEPWAFLRVWPCEGEPITLTREEAEANVGEQLEWWLKRSGRGSIKLVQRRSDPEARKNARVIRGVAALSLHDERPAPWKAPAAPPK